MDQVELITALEELAEKPAFKREHFRDFAFDLLQSLDMPKAALTKLQQTTASEALDTSLLWKKKLVIQYANTENLSITLDNQKLTFAKSKQKPRFFFACDGENLRGCDSYKNTLIDIPLTKLAEEFRFFLPLIGIEQYEALSDNIADIRATTRIKKFYHEILVTNSDWLSVEGQTAQHHLNLFIMRILFCFFAEDTGIFQKHPFTATVIELSNPNGKNTAEIIAKLFQAMALPNSSLEKQELPLWARDFEYVNGGLFKDITPVPQFSTNALRLFKDCGDYNWKEINPDIFGSMMQVIADPELRGNNGMHYTSVTNIMKLLHPLFLQSLEEQLHQARNLPDNAQKEKALNVLLKRLHNIHIFDPACGSGNFLITAYRQLRELEWEIWKDLKKLVKQFELPLSGIKLDHFFGLEISDFAAQTAWLSLWIAEYQMNAKTSEIFSVPFPVLPLRESGQIQCQNSLATDWEAFCQLSSHNNSDKIKSSKIPEFYIVGNPPFHGSKHQSIDQKNDQKVVFTPYSKNYKNLDYVACWFLKAVQLLASVPDAVKGAAFVSTNSICQGTQVELLWPLILKENVEIGFAYPSFKWRNNANHNAGVTCVIVGLRSESKLSAWLFKETETATKAMQVKHISPYLTDADSDIIVQRRSKPLSKLPDMIRGNMPVDNGHLMLSREEKQNIVQDYPQAETLIRRIYGSQEFIRGYERYCLWISDKDLTLAYSIPPIVERLEQVKKFRLQSPKAQTIEFAKYPYRFVEVKNNDQDAFIIPRVSSERRQYLSVGLIEVGNIINDRAFAIFNPPDYLFAVLSSRLHLLWLDAVGGRMRTDFSYSNSIVYNTFPLPPLTLEQQEALADAAAEILEAREAYPAKTIAELYDPDRMKQEFPDLLAAHQHTDEILEDIYQEYTKMDHPFADDAERLRVLFNLYSKMITAEQKAKIKKNRKKTVKDKE
ncbi:MAG: DNA methyltransferase [Zymomonas mobilis subsp. pomaceae]|uniref:class I SAM-dependent DNA methyltransferase n=1 Tax=Zymomonas mobilis TaxID=542 RepID=UPI0001B70607|nr:DNA methyltransferase [Zymomonas mobilis]ACV76370.1 putative type II restriction enzyme (methylase subunit) [Zymomonas mobilis subsp. mobilis NCIMB 11163]